MQISQLVTSGLKELRSAGIVHPEPDVYILLGHALKKTRTELLLAAGEQVSAEKSILFQHYLSRRKKREPVAYILGEREFWSLPFYVSRDVLIPRPETEFLLETVLKKVKNKKTAGLVGDICCGSGVIAVILALELKTSVVAVDISRKAIDVARKNCRRHRVDTQISFTQSDLLTGFQDQPCFSLIVTNPPYVIDHQLANELEPEVFNYEPHIALNGGERGIEVINRLKTQLVERLIPGGCFFMEIGSGQGEEIQELFTSGSLDSKPFDFIEILKDYSGRDRVVYGGLKS